MDEIVKSFKFECENVQLILNIKKTLDRKVLHMFIDAEVINGNDELTISKSVNISSRDTALLYKNSVFFWVSHNKWKGLRWDKYANETKYPYYRNVKEMREVYIQQRDFIDIIAAYFYDSMRTYIKAKNLYDTDISEIID